MVKKLEFPLHVPKDTPLKVKQCILMNALHSESFKKVTVCRLSDIYLFPCPYQSQERFEVIDAGALRFLTQCYRVEPSYKSLLDINKFSPDS